MTHVWRTPDLDRTASAAMVTRSLRCWRQACDAELPVQPHLCRMLDAQNCAVLAPVFDSLFRFYEAALHRQLAIGDGDGVSEDESLLLSLIDRPDLCGSRLDCGQGIALGFNCALCSTRIMLALALNPPAGSATRQ